MDVSFAMNSTNEMYSCFNCPYITDIMNSTFTDMTHHKYYILSVKITDLIMHIALFIQLYKKHRN
jgi:hypothetical protein